MLLTHKPLSNIVEAHITRATGGSKEQFIGEALFGSRFQRLSFLPIHAVGMGPQKGTGMENVSRIEFLIVVNFHFLTGDFLHERF